MINSFYTSNGNDISTNLQIELVVDDEQNSLLNVFPNPFSGEVSFEFELYQSEAVTISPADNTGIKYLYNSDFLEGSHIYSFNNTDNLLNGPVFYTIQLGENIYSGYIFKIVE